MSLIAGVLVIARTFGVGSKSKGYQAYSVMTAVAGLASLVLWIALAKVARIQIMNGVLQR